MVDRVVSIYVFHQNAGVLKLILMRVKHPAATTTLTIFQLSYYFPIWRCHRCSNVRRRLWFNTAAWHTFMSGYFFLHQHHGYWCDEQTCSKQTLVFQYQALINRRRSRDWVLLRVDKFATHTASTLKQCPLGCWSYGLEFPLWSSVWPDRAFPWPWVWWTYLKVVWQKIEIFCKFCPFFHLFSRYQK